MKTYYTEKTAAHKQYQWERVSQNEYQCGSVRLFLGLDHRGIHCWHYEIKIKNQWRKAWVKSRPWGYGDRGKPSAMVGFNQIKEFYYD